MIRGKYDFGDHVFIDSKYICDQKDVEYHELTHHAITQGSLYGVLEIILKKICIWYEPNIQYVLIEFLNASLTTQEMTAIYAQCLYYKLLGEEELKKFEYHLHEGDYYKKYCIAGFDEIVHYKQYDIEGTALLTAIAIIALNIDITLAEPDWTNPLQIRKIILENRAQYHVDYRYRQLIKAILQLIRRGEIITEQRILEISGITYLKRNYDNLVDMLHRLSEQLSVKYSLDAKELQYKIDEIMASEDEILGKPSIQEIEQRVIPTLLNNQYVLPPADKRNFNSLMNSVTVTLHDKSFINQGVGTETEKIDCLIFHHATRGWRYPVMFERTETCRFLSEFQGEIIVFTEDYDEFKRDVLIPTGKRVFYRYDGRWHNFVTQIRSSKIPYIHLHEVNSLINCVFVINECNEVFFTLQTKSITHYIVEEIRKGKFVYVNILEDNKTIKDCFYFADTDWCRFENVILSVVNRNLMDFSEGFTTIGGRINM